MIIWVKKLFLSNINLSYNLDPLETSFSLCTLFVNQSVFDIYKEQQGAFDTQLLYICMYI